MGKFQFRLATLLRIREGTRDERRMQLAEAFAAEEKLRERKRELEMEESFLRESYHEAVGRGMVNVDRLLDKDRYDLVLKSEMATIETQAAQLAGEIERRRQALVTADREVRALEKVRETWQERHRYGVEVASQKQIDEAAVQSFTNRSSLEV